MVQSNYVPFQYISLRHEYDAIYIAHLSDYRIDRLHVHKFTESSFIHFNLLLFAIPILWPYVFRLQFSIFLPRGVFSIFLVHVWQTSNQIDELSSFPVMYQGKYSKYLLFHFLSQRSLLRCTVSFRLYIFQLKFMLNVRLILYQ